MFKYIGTSLLLCTFLSAESFDVFLQKAIEKSVYLDALSIEKKEIKIQSEISLKYKNPNLEITHSSFKPTNGSHDDGYILNLTQPIRLWGVADDKEALVGANVKASSASFTQKRAEFIRDISLKYTLFSQAKRVLALSHEELEIAKKIYEISAVRFENGAISRGIKLQALLDYERSKNLKDLASMHNFSSYYELLSYAGIEDEIELDESYDFSIKSISKEKNNPTLEVLKAQKDEALKEAKVNSHATEWIDVFGEFESEPDQDILRFGINIPLAIFNNNKELSRVSTLRATKLETLSKNEQSITNMELKKLLKERESLLKLKGSYEAIIKSETKLLEMYEDGYKISSINLIELQDIKNKMLQSKRALIEIDTSLNQNAINSNYIKGAYNE